MFKFIKKLFKRKDYVIIRTASGMYLQRKVVWICDKPFSYTYYESELCKLLPGGKIVGQPYEISWGPASENMQKYYNKQV